MSIFKIFSADDPSWCLEVEGGIMDLPNALEWAAEELFQSSSGECGARFDLFCDGKLYQVKVEYEPVFSVNEVDLTPPAMPTAGHITDEVGDCMTWCHACALYRLRLASHKAAKGRLEDVQKHLHTEGER